MQRLSGLSVLLVLFLFTGCYHATVDTGLTPNGEVVEKDWAHGFVYGLVPPSEVDVAADCPNGVAQVETELSFLNQIASALTWGLYTPMSIRVACAAGPDQMSMNDSNSFEVLDADPDPDVLDRAVRMAIETGETTYLKFISAD